MAGEMKQKCPMEGPDRESIIRNHICVHTWIFHSHWKGHCVMVADAVSVDTFEIWDGEYGKGVWYLGELAEVKGPLERLAILRELWEKRTWDSGKVPLLKS
jgi:hypothetical protein